MLLIIALSFLNRCIYLPDKNPIAEQSAITTPVTQKTILESCDDYYTNHSGNKKKLCLDACEAKREQWLPTLLHAYNEALVKDCRKH